MRLSSRSSVHASAPLLLLHCGAERSRAGFRAHHRWLARVPGGAAVLDATRIAGGSATCGRCLWPSAATSSRSPGATLPLRSSCEGERVALAPLPQLWRCSQHSLSKHVATVADRAACTPCIWCDCVVAPLRYSPPGVAGRRRNAELWRGPLGTGWCLWQGDMEPLPQRHCAANGAAGRPVLL